MIRMLTLLCLAVLLLAAPVAAQMVSEPPEEARVRTLAKTLRCPVCQSESILESRSGTARQMVVMLREMMGEGRSDTEITAFFVDRYGPFVMLEPPATTTAGRFIWTVPLMLLTGGGLVLFVILRWRRPVPIPSAQNPLSADRLQEMEL